MNPDDRPTRSDLAADKFEDDVIARGRRDPYVGVGADGANRSATIDLEELDTLDPDDPAAQEAGYRLLVSIEAWRRQAARDAVAEAIPR
jgi:hypothetical protein